MVSVASAGWKSGAGGMMEVRTPSPPLLLPTPDSNHFHAQAPLSVGAVHQCTPACTIERWCSLWLMHYGILSCILWHLMATFAILWQLVETYGVLWPSLAAFGI